ncbi:MAG: heavy metal translocating P-type ATPase [Pseudomonadota bacterium]
MTDLTASSGCPSGLSAPVEIPANQFDPSVFVRREGNLNRLDLLVRGAKCAGCLGKIERTLGAVPGVEEARLNLTTGQLRLAWRGDAPASALVGRLMDLGYGVGIWSTGEAADDRAKEERSLLVAMGVAGFAMANIMLLSVSVWAGHGEMGEATRQAMHAISGAIALPVVLFSGRHFFQSAWSVLKRGHANMDVPISLAISLAFVVSVVETVRGGEHAYFDAVVMLLFFLLIGRFLDARLRRRAHTAAEQLAAMRSRSVTRLGADGIAHAVRVDDIAPGDRIQIAPGERAVLDVTILDGESEVDESLVTGESLPQQALPGRALKAGSINLTHPLIARVDRAASDSLLADMADMLEAGEQRRSAFRRIADKAVAWYVPFVHTTAALAFIGWLVIGASVPEAVMVAVSTLIITCPCALALAAPVVQVVAAGRLFKAGVYLKSGDALERLASVDHIVCDKTGTLTLGTPTLIRRNGDEALLSSAAQLARGSHHPLSRALVAVVGAGPIAADIREHKGLGVEGAIEGRACRLGSAEWVGLSENAADNPYSGKPTIWFDDGTGAAPEPIGFEDSLRAEAGDTLVALRRRGLGVEILSGDRNDAVAEAAAKLGVDRWQAAVTPSDKVDRLESLRADGKTTLMVGDGLNDVGALALAHASLAPGGAMDVTQSASDAVYSGGLEAIVQVVDTARRTRTIMVQNFGLAAAYNLIAVPIAVTGHVTPLIAAIAMSASSLIVTLNALRLQGPATT